MDFQDFPMILGNLGVETDHPPEMCAGLAPASRSPTRGRWGHRDAAGDCRISVPIVSRVLGRSKFCDSGSVKVLVRNPFSVVVQVVAGVPGRRDPDARRPRREARRQDTSKYVKMTSKYIKNTI